MKEVKFVAVIILLSSMLNAQTDTAKAWIQSLQDMSLEELLNITITTANKTEEKVSDIPASAVVITRTDIERYGYKNLGEILENVSGLFCIDEGLEGKVIGVRGFWSEPGNNMILLINGVRQERNESDGAVYMSPTVDVSAIDRIEVVRGPMSVIYGTGAFLGVINVFTNDANNSSQASVSYGTNATTRLAARAAINEKDVSLVFNAGYYHTAGPDIPHSEMSSFDLSGLTPFTSTKGLWGKETKYFNISGAYKGFYTNFTMNQIFDHWYLLFLPTSEDGSWTKVNYTSISFGYNAEFSSKFSLDSKVTYRVTSSNGAFSWYVPEGMKNVGGDNNDREDYELELTANYNPNNILKLTSGIFYKNRMQEQLISVYPYINLMYILKSVDPIETRAFFTQADITVSKSLKFVAGFRLEQTPKYSVFYQDITQHDTAVASAATFKKDQIEFIPRLAAVLHLNDHNVVKLMYGKAIIQPGFFKIVAEATSNQPPLSPEYISTTELNYLAAFSPNLSVNTSLFYNKFDGLIMNQPIFDPYSGIWTSGYFSNSGKLETIGVELTLHARPTEELNLELSGTIQKTKDKREGYTEIDVAYSPGILGYMKASYFFNTNTNLAFTGRYVGTMETLWDYTIGSSGGRIANKVDGYFIVAANLRFSNLFDDGFYVNINVNNLLDTKYLYPSYTFSSYWADKGIGGLGREIVATVGCKF